MAAKTKFPIRFFERLAAEYDLGRFIEAKPFKRGYVQTNVLVRAAKGRFVLRYYEHRPEKYILFEANILNHFSKHRYPCAMPIRNVHGDFLGSYKGKHYAVFEYLPGKHLKNLNKQQYHEMVKHLAKLHNISRRYKPKYFESRECHDKKCCIDAAKAEVKRFKSKKGQERYKYIRKRLDLLKFPNNLPKGVVHCDFDKANIKFIGNKITGVLDFDDACYTYLIYDVGMVILYWAFFYPRKLDFAKAREIIRIYNKYRRLSKSEKEHIYDGLQIVMLMMMAWFLHDKWKGMDLFERLKKMLEKLDGIGRQKFYNKLFK